MKDVLSESSIPWDAFGVCPTYIDGWSFSSSSALVVLAPVEFTVTSRGVTVSGDAFWQDRIRFTESNLILRLPLVAKDASRILLLPPECGLPTMVEPKIMVATHEAGELEAVWRITDTGQFTVLKGQPIARIVALSGAAARESIEDGDLSLRIWRLHPRGVHICRAEKTLHGNASSAAMRWCGPFAHANAYGFWVFPPFDIDIIWHGGRSFEHRLNSLYTDEDAALVTRLQRPEDHYRYTPRKKIEFGSTLDSVVSVWTGCIFQTPPGWGLMIRDPININSSAIFRVQEAILETDWMSYDIWINLLFIQQDKWAHIRRGEGWPPIAQLVPVPTAAYDRAWSLTDGPLERTSAKGSEVYERWIDYNYKKWVAQGEKEPATYFRERHFHKRRDNS